MRIRGSLILLLALLALAPLDYGFSAEGTTSTVTTEFFDFGVDVNAKAPPAGQVAALEDFIRP